MKTILIFSLLACLAVGCEMSEPRQPIAEANLPTPVAVASSLTEQSVVLPTGVTLKYVEWGKPGGVPVIFLHGLSDSWHSFEQVLPLLPLHIHAFALTQRGHGDSSKPDSGYTPKDFAADVAAFMQEKNIAKAIVAGHSMGGVHALQFTVDYPELTAGTVIICSEPALGDNAGIPELLASVPENQVGFERAFMEEFQQSTIAKPISRDYFNSLVDESVKIPVPVFRQILKALIETDLTGRMAEIRTPFLAIWGDKDALFPRSGQEKMVGAIPHARWLVYPGAGHSVHWEEPQGFAKEVAGFVAGLQ